MAVSTGMADLCPVLVEIALLDLEKAGSNGMEAGVLRRMTVSSGPETRSNPSE
jgi:hypothetical protein